MVEDFIFKDPNGLEWKTPAGWEVDGASIPQAAWSLVGGPLSGRYLHASVIHDKYCDTRERTAHDTHRSFYYAMRANGVSKAKAMVMYMAVRTFGPNWILNKTVKKLKTRSISIPQKTLGAVGNNYVKRRASDSSMKVITTRSPAYSLKTTETELEKLALMIKPESSLEDIETLSDSVREERSVTPVQREPVIRVFE